MYNNQNGMYANYEVETNKEYTESKSESSYVGNKPMYGGTTMNMGCSALPGCVMPPVYECPKERVIHREIMHEVPHVVPINTRIINHHIYRHTYSPCYTCCEEDEVCNVTDGCPCNF